MQISFGANVVCPLKKLVKKTDSPKLKEAVASNVAMLEKLCEAKGLQKYMGDDEFVFTRGRGKKVNFFLKVNKSSEQKGGYLFYSGYEDSFLPSNSFSEVLMAYLCQKHKVQLPLPFKGWLDTFCDFVKKQKGM